MRKKLTGISLAVVACLLVAIPASASAAGTLTSGSTAVPVGTGITGEATNPTSFRIGSGSSSFGCGGANLSGSVYSNTEATAKVLVNSFKFVGPKAEGKCETPYGPAAVSIDSATCLRGETTGWSLRGAGCEVNAKPLGLAIVSSSPSCHYHGTTSSFTGNINSEPLIISQNKGTEFVIDSGQPFTCLTSITMEGLSLKLKTAGGSDLKMVW